MDIRFLPNVLPFLICFTAKMLPVRKVIVVSE